MLIITQNWRFITIEYFVPESFVTFASTKIHDESSHMWMLIANHVKHNRCVKHNMKHFKVKDIYT
jgi:hypothetical protein